ncbi:4-alpha-glucanotransferase [Pseudaquabacterium rugosum]|uniref:4-alpha-glucanotransferase n=1 Tax=Pseudaquabacterium rugosum TaxID=2984194 RepID=A0ABU9B8A9_9BURK
MRLPRASGILLHPTSLPGPHGSGDLGPEARHFIDWLGVAGQRLWQILPLGPIGPGHSPYMSGSACAGNPLLIDLGELQQRGWLDSAELADAPRGDPHRVDWARVVPWRMARLEQAAARFARQADATQQQALADWAAGQAHWLDDYLLFMALDEAHPGLRWTQWPAALAARAPDALAAARQRLAPRIAFWRFVQWCFARQWQALRAHARSRGVRIVGDAPIFIAHHSAEVWAAPALFELDAAGEPTVIAGVPPDYFSATGQRWGNPLYRWSAHAADGYRWWIARLRHIFEQVDIVRIDHFRGFCDYWEIPADEPTAIHGRWRPGPGRALFDAAQAALGALPVIAEDLGILTPDVVALRQALDFPGMRILQFAFDGGADNVYLPHHHSPDSVVYTGTHDNDTTLGWWSRAGDHERHHVRSYLATDGHDIAWAMLRAASASVADTCIHPMQDVLTLDGSARMNLPGQGEGWWAWRFDWSQVHGWHGQRLAEMTRLFGRDAD